MRLWPIKELFNSWTKLEQQIDTSGEKSQGVDNLHAKTRIILEYLSDICVGRHLSVSILKNSLFYLCLFFVIGVNCIREISKIFYLGSFSQKFTHFCICISSFPPDLFISHSHVCLITVSKEVDIVLQVNIEESSTLCSQMTHSNLTHGHQGHWIVPPSHTTSLSTPTLTANIWAHADCGGCEMISEGFHQCQDNTQDHLKCAVRAW